MLLIQQLHNILIKVHNEAHHPFSGLGLIICDDITNVPIYPLYKSNIKLSGNSLFEQLLELSSQYNTHHDGFHVVSSKLAITHIAQYFYPHPIVDINLDAQKHYGVRYFVAQAGSAVPNVSYSAVVGLNYGVSIFEKGKKLL